jgi:peptidase E
MQLHLFSMPGEYPLRDIVAAGQPHLLAQPQPTVLYLPATGVTIKEEYVEMTREAFKGLAQVEVLDLTTGACTNRVHSA